MCNSVLLVHPSDDRLINRLGGQSGLCLITSLMMQVCICWSKAACKPNPSLQSLCLCISICMVSSWHAQFFKIYVQGENYFKDIAFRKITRLSYLTISITFLGLDVLKIPDISKISITVRIQYIHAWFIQLYAFISSCISYKTDIYNLTVQDFWY